MEISDIVSPRSYQNPLHTMPTIIAVDVSLSMTRPVPVAASGVGPSAEDGLTYHHMAVQGVNAILDYLAKHSRLEFVSLVSENPFFN